MLETALLSATEPGRTGHTTGASRAAVKNVKRVKVLISVLKCSDFLLTCSDVVLKVLDFVLKMLDFVLKMLILAEPGSGAAAG